MVGQARPGDGHWPADDAVAAERLTVAWRWWCLIGLVGLAAAAVVLRPALPGGSARWLLVNLAALGALLAFMRRSLQRNRRSPEAPLLGELGAGNHATLARGVLIAHLPGYLLYPWPSGWQTWLPTLTFTASLIADYLDGYLARRADRVTGLGEALDIEFDGLGLMAATALAVHYGQLPVVYFLTVGCARYLFLIVHGAARLSKRTLYPLPPSEARRALAGVTMELAAAALWPIAPPAMVTLAGGIVAIPFLAGFGRDTLVHLGWVDATSAGYQHLRRVLIRIATVVLPPILRVAIVLLLGPLLFSALRVVIQGDSAALVLEAAAPMRWVAVLVVGIVCLGAIALGIAGRAGAVGIIVVYGIAFSLAGLTERCLAVWGCAFAIYVFGTGPGSLWQPERSFYLRRAGAKA